MLTQTQHANKLNSIKSYKLKEREMLLQQK